ncbi:MAG: response regulator [Nitrospiria bacterium]
MTKKILMIDDSPVAIKVLKKCLPSDMEFECYSAGDGAEGVAKYISLKPDFTFLDLTMPVMGGIQTLESILAINKDAVVIMVTADTQKKVFEKVISIGAFMLIAKPPTKEIVSAVLSKAMLELKNRGS